MYRRMRKVGAGRTQVRMLFRVRDPCLIEGCSWNTVFKTQTTDILYHLREDPTRIQSGPLPGKEDERLLRCSSEARGRKARPNNKKEADDRVSSVHVDNISPFLSWKVVDSRL
eukprot:GILK01012982.1.p1 GENE.GILK01012982.1~~GILK01012982.1.p1  ORF type:complete len:113 (+),score=9.32 GILK01012982.1:219-557(+)